MSKIRLIADEEDYVVAYKPQGVSFHSESEAGFVVLLEQQLCLKLYAVHRLDKVTSGIIVLAKSSQAAAIISELFSSRNIEKYYLALITGKPKKKQGWIKGDMAKSRRGAHKLLTSKINPAITRFYSQSLKANLRAVLMKPFTGKTHQLRVAMKSNSTPILGDDLYSGDAAERVYLHAYAIRFEYNGQCRTYSSVPDNDCQFSLLTEHEVFQQWQTPWNLEW